MTMDLFENDLHLYAIDGEKGQGWNSKQKKWVPIAPEVASGIFLDGVKLTKSEAKKFFPDAKPAPDLN